MAVSKRTRYEVLRRDNHTCRYCGGTAPDVKITLDHVTPVALGGTDAPDNLVAACWDCNIGKASTSPDAVLVVDVTADAIRWANALAKATEIKASEAEKQREAFDWFEEMWAISTPAFAYLPVDWRQSVNTFHASGLTLLLMQDAVEIAAGRPGLEQRQMFKYFCGICWSKVRELRKIADEILAAEVE